MNKILLSAALFFVVNGVFAQTSEKELLKKTFNTNILAVVGVVFGLILTFEFIVFPGLTAPDTILNLLSILRKYFTISFVSSVEQLSEIIISISFAKLIKCTT